MDLASCGSNSKIKQVMATVLLAGCFFIFQPRRICSTRLQVKLAHMILAEEYFREIAAGRKTWEFRKDDNYWRVRLLKATHCVFQQGSSAALCRWVALHDGLRVMALDSYTAFIYLDR